MLTELDVAQQVSKPRPVNRSAEAQIAKDASVIQSLCQNEAVSKALSRATTPITIVLGERTFQTGCGASFLE